MLNKVLSFPTSYASLEDTVFFDGRRLFTTIATLGFWHLPETESFWHKPPIKGKRFGIRPGKKFLSVLPTFTQAAKAALFSNSLVIKEEKTKVTFSLVDFIEDFAPPSASPAELLPIERVYPFFFSHPLPGAGTLLWGDGVVGIWDWGDEIYAVDASLILHATRPETPRREKPVFVPLQAVNLLKLGFNSLAIYENCFALISPTDGIWWQPQGDIEANIQIVESILFTPETLTTVAFYVTSKTIKRVQTLADATVKLQFKRGKVFVVTEALEEEVGTAQSPIEELSVELPILRTWWLSASNHQLVKDPHRRFWLAGTAFDGSEILLPTLTGEES